MADISEIIAPKSDQLNADDLAASDRTIRIREVKVLGAGREQPIHVYFDGDNGKPWKPCKTMARLLANLWKMPDTSQWVGRSVTLYRDPDVLWAGAKVGGIRVRAVSHIAKAQQVAITESQKKRKLTVIEPLVADVKPIVNDAARKWADAYIAKVNEAPDLDTLNAFTNEKAKKLAELQTARPELHLECLHALDNRRSALAAGPVEVVPDFSDDDDTWGEEAE